MKVGTDFADCADFALGLREQFGESGKGGNGKTSHQSPATSLQSNTMKDVAALTLAASEMLQKSQL